MNQDNRIAVIGQGIVGYPLTLLLSKFFDVVGFDIDPLRITSLRNQPTSRSHAKKLEFTDNPQDLKSANVYILTVPIEVTDVGTVHTGQMMRALSIVGELLDRDDLVIIESTVYIGFTENVAAKQLAQISGLIPNVDFQIGYSSERINPGDSVHSIETIVKVVSGGTSVALERVDFIYRSAIRAGTCRAHSIAVAEASKLLENAQRFVNISLMNEVAIELNKLGIQSSQVLEVARTKWNFNFYSPGIVGGQCLELSTRLMQHSFQNTQNSKSILEESLSTNENTIRFIVKKVENLVIRKIGTIDGWKVLILGITFKENYPEVKGTKILNLVRAFQHSGARVDVFDPYINAKEKQIEWEVNCLTSIDKESLKNYQAVVVAQAHEEFKLVTFNKSEFPNTVVFDIRSVIKYSDIDGSL